jgi:excinuclease ABC subunit A
MKKENVDKLIVRGARTHNLKNITVEMPRNKMIVITGVSGSGKSSLAFDTIFAEGQRRYVESLSAYARQFLNQMPKPDVDEITGLSPAISIDQKSRSNNPRSTVATITEIYDYLRVLYARVGRPHCPICGLEIKKLSNEEILNFIFEKIKKFDKTLKKRKVMGVEFNDAKISVYSPVVRGRKGEYYQMLYDLLNKGFQKVRLDGEIKDLRNRIELSKTKKHNIDVLVDSFSMHEFKDNNGDARMRLAEAVELAIVESDGLVTISFEKIGQNPLQLEEFVMSTKFSCPRDGFSFPEIEPRLFSFNSPYGACPICNGLGSKFFMGDEPCEVCNGARLRPEALNVFLGKKTNIVNLTKLSIEKVADFFIELELTEQEKEISKVIIKEIEARIQFLLNVGLDYLSLDRKANTL